MDKSIVNSLTIEELAELVKKRDSNWKDTIQAHIPQKERDFPTDPVVFAKEVLETDLWEKQVEIATSVVENRNTIVEASKGVGKSYLSAILICWWLCTNEEAKVVVIAPSNQHVRKVIFSAVRYFWDKYDLPGEVMLTGRWEIGDHRFAVGLSPKRSQEDVTSLQGYHHENLLVIMDEAPGLPATIWKAAQGLVTYSTNRWLAIGNPIQRAGPFWDRCNSKSWNYIHISALDSPNVAAKEDYIPGLTSYVWVSEAVEEHCMPVKERVDGAFIFDGQWYKPDAYFEANVLGRAPDDAESQLFPYWMIKEAQNIELEPEPSEPIVIGVDPSRGGNDCVMVVRKGMKVLEISRATLHDNDPDYPKGEQIADWICDKVRSYDTSQVFIDGSGGYGGAAIDFASKKGVSIIPVYGSGAPILKKKFTNLRSELYWRIRTVMQRRMLDIPKDDLLEADLIAQEKEFDALGRIKLLAKELIAKKIQRSPDASDALSYSFADESIDALTGNEVGAREEEYDNPEVGSRWVSGADEVSVGSKWEVTSGNPQNRRWSRWG